MENGERVRVLQARVAIAVTVLTLVLSVGAAYVGAAARVAVLERTVADNAARCAEEHRSGGDRLRDLEATAGRIAAVERDVAVVRVEVAGNTALLREVREDVKKMMVERGLR